MKIMDEEIEELARKLARMTAEEQARVELVLLRLGRIPEPGEILREVPTNDLWLLTKALDCDLSTIQGDRIVTFCGPTSTVLSGGPNWDEEENESDNGEELSPN
jgi:hypothetical protein